MVLDLMRKGGVGMGVRWRGLGMGGEKARRE
jgi:hypothetical protein